MRYGIDGIDGAAVSEVSRARKMARGLDSSSGTAYKSLALQRATQVFENWIVTRASPSTDGEVTRTSSHKMWTSKL